MTKLQIISDNDKALPIIQTAIATQLKRLEIGLKKTKQEIKKFETKYQTSSEQFLRELKAEDPAGGDDDYVDWMGELKLKESIREELQAIQDVEYVTQ